MITEERIPLLASSMKVNFLQLSSLRMKLVQNIAFYIISYIAEGLLNLDPTALAPLYRQVKENFELSFFQKGKLVHQGIYLLIMRTIQPLYRLCIATVVKWFVPL